MYEAIFELEAITPLFMRGADQRKAEFRSASVKGVMRWWFRALAGNYFGNNIKALREAEGKVFGSAGSGEAKKSRVFVRAEVKDKREGSVFQHAASWRDEKAIVWSEYVDYLFFSALDKRKNRNTGGVDVKSRFRYYDTGSKFEVVLSSHDRDAFLLAEAALWMAINLGGFGFRARRGAGSLRVTKTKGDFNLKFNNFGSLREFAQEVSTVVSQFNEAIGNLGVSPGKNKRDRADYPLYPVFEQENSLIFTREEWAGIRYHSDRKEKWVSALDNFGRWFLDIKRGRKFSGGFRFRCADYALSHTFERLTDNKVINEVSDQRTYKSRSPREKRYYLGLPIRYANYSTTVSGWLGSVPTDNKDIEGALRSKKNTVERRASGYWLSLVDIGGILYPMVTVFASQFYPDYSGVFYFDKQDKWNRIYAKGLVTITGENNSSAYRFYKKWIENIAQGIDGKFVVLWPRREF
ncbi:type III-B CRISPR module RAMP protein Cmr1 [Thermococcus sp. Bubb.Bath]|uniref:type III-B CRISPR module RAMP protein Cmr1 n=1 Tax=Thermococcus sp. Bubb.Bath TaxID=1638242 RepID=UPI001438D811|nr:type III-B CRISPR module RAMP protein Cmr1 [Thermococcus sp. Bubb.Bath]NJF24415.1 type III-B CRISPR module RAMP protein Cmr1 [Thermococcus sp. Bubb.Bath]